MIAIKIGTVLSLQEFKTGVKEGKTWGYVPVKAQKGYDRITVWIENAVDIEPDWGQAEITSISAVKLAAYRDPASGKYFKQYSVTARVKSSKGYLQMARDEDLDEIFG